MQESLLESKIKSQKIGGSLNRVLVIDDEKEICEYLSGVLSDQGFVVESIQDPSALSAALERYKPEVMLIDLRMPGQSGLEVIREMRQKPAYSGTALIAVTGMAGEDDKVAALDLGADDYVVKPVLPKELAARIRAVLRRRANTGGEEKISADGLVIDLKAHKVLQNGAEVYLTLTEFRILSELVRHQGRVLSRDKLRETALANLAVTDRTIDVHMASLRKKLEHYANHIQTVRGVGYRFTV